MDRERNGFPIEWDMDGYVSRREFFKFITLTSGGLAIGSAALAGWAALPRNKRTFDPVLIEGGSQITPGSSLAFDFPRKGDICLLVRHADGEFAAFSRRCTHLSCPVLYQTDQDRLFCPCHNGAFSARDGSVLQGPPPHALPRVLLEIRQGEVWAVGVRLAGELA